MDRRGVILGLPMALAGVSAVSLTGPLACTPLEPNCVSVDMRVFDRGEGIRFALTLFDKPWPKVGDRVSFDFEGLHLVGTVTEFTAEPKRGNVLYHIQGTVEEFDGESPRERWKANYHAQKDKG